MTVTSTRKDPEGLRLGFVAEFDAPVERVWQLWADPRRLERWWGPPGYPATFETYEFTEGGQARYHMRDGEGQTYPGWWTITAIEEPHRLEFDDGFIDAEGERSVEMGSTHAGVVLEPLDDGTRMTLTSRFESRRQFDEMDRMGMEEGMRLSLGQMDAVLADD